MATVVEIERKWRIMPDSPGLARILQQSEYYFIRQAYFSSTRAQSDRVRIIYGCGTQHAERTRKHALADMRERVEETHVIDFQEACSIFEAAEQRIEKTRFVYGEFEIDVFHGVLSGLVLLEIELRDKDEEVILPEGLAAQEVTYDPQYLNVNLAHLESIAQLGGDSGEEQIVTTIEEGLRVCEERILAHIEEYDDLVIVAVSGPSASGKSSRVSEALARMFPRGTRVLHLDDYFIGVTKMQEKGLPSDYFDSPHAVDLALAARHIQELREIGKIQKPIYSFESSERVGVEPFMAPRHLLVVDGIFALHPLLQNLFDIRLFIDVSAHSALWRRLLRDVERTGQTAEEIFTMFTDITHPASQVYVATQRDFADVVMTNDMVPHLEMQLEDARSVHIKALVTPDIYEILHKMGFSPRREGPNFWSQTDSYYAHVSQETQAGSEEIVRLRHEVPYRDFSWGRAALSITYKGPRDDFDFSRGKMSIQFKDLESFDEIEKRLLGLGYQHIGDDSQEHTIRKIRRFWDHPERAVHIALDIVSLPFRRWFIEIRGERSADVMDVVAQLKDLGIPPDAFTEVSYLELCLWAQ